MTAALSAPPQFDWLVADLVARAVDARIAEVQRPDLIHQRSVERVAGMPARDYLRHCRAGDWPTWCDRRLRYARTADVVAWVEAHPGRVPVQADTESETFGRARAVRIRRIG